MGGRGEKGGVRKGEIGEGETGEGSSVHLSSAILPPLNTLLHKGVL